MAYNVVSLAREDFDSFSIIKAVLDEQAGDTFVQDIMAGPCRVMNIDVNAPGADGYLKMYDHKTPTIGTTAPDFVIEFPSAGGAVSMPIPIPSGGLKFNTGLSFTFVTTGGTAGDTGPAADVTVTLTALKGVA
jgi:hypothetical protein